MTHIVVTGGAAGIGKSLTRRLAAGGTRVSVLDQVDSRERWWWNRLPVGTRGDWYTVDVADPDAVESSIRAASRAVPVDGLATCVGIVRRGSTLRDNRDDLVMTMTMTMTHNLVSTFVASHTIARTLVSDGRPGSFVTLSSTPGIGYVSGLGASHHAATAGVIGLTRSMAGDLARHGIRVNCVAPGLVLTPLSQVQRSDLREHGLTAQIRVGRPAEAKEVAATIDWLLSAASSFTTGHILPVDGGQLSVAVPPAGGHTHGVRPSARSRGSLRSRPRSVVPAFEARVHDHRSRPARGRRSTLCSRAAPRRIPTRHHASKARRRLAPPSLDETEVRDDDDA